MDKPVRYEIDEEEYNAILYSLGENVHRFFTEPLGKYLLEQAAYERSEHLARIMACDETDTETIIKEKRELNAINRAMFWLNKTMTDGDEAYALLANK